MHLQPAPVATGDGVDQRCFKGRCKAQTQAYSEASQLAWEACPRFEVSQKEALLFAISHSGTLREAEAAKWPGPSSYKTRCHPLSCSLAPLPASPEFLCW